MAGEDERYKQAIGRALAEIAPVAEGVLRPKWIDESEGDVEIFGVRISETREFAARALTRRLKVIGLA
jgi:ribonucleoside-diphosphate reductase beta chain